MAKKRSRTEQRKKIHGRVRSKILGTPDRPRLCVYRSLKHTYAQVIDDVEGKVLTQATTLKLGDQKLAQGGNMAAAKRVGQEIAERARKLGVERVVFDRNGYVYHGRVRAIAEAAREAGLKF